MNKSNEIEAIYTLSPMQEVMLYNFVAYEGKGKAFVNQLSFHISGNIDIELLQESFNRLIERYDILRTIFIYKKVQRPRQVVLKQRYASFFFEDISGLEESQRKLRIEEAGEKDVAKGFDITRDLLIRISIFKLDEKRYCLICSYHHIIADGWSLNIMLSELMDTYSYLKGNRPIMQQRALPYKDYIAWYERNNKKQDEFWENHFKGFNEMTYFLGAHPKPDGDSVMEEYRFLIEEDITEQLKKIASKNAVTLNSLLQTVWGILLAKYNDTDDVVFGSVITVRPVDIPGIEDAVGLFLNTIPVRIRFEYTQSFTSLLSEVHNSLVELRTYEHIPSLDLQSLIGQKGELFNHIVTFQNMSFDKKLSETIKYHNLEFEIENLMIKENTGYDFSIEITLDKGLVIKFNYNTAMYDYDTITRLEGHFRRIISQIAESPGIAIEEIDILTDKEKEEIIQRFNDTRVEYPKKTIVELFEKRVNETPGGTALIFENKKLSYSELNYKADCLAKALKQRGIGRGCIVGVVIKRSIEMLVGILGVLKAGGAYLPIDPAYPSERIRYMLNDSKTNMLLIQKDIEKKVEFEFEKLIIDAEAQYAQPVCEIQNKSQLDDLAYVIYTSGSTGDPKGVMIEHRAVANFIKGFEDKIEFTSGKPILSVTSMSFDMFVFDTLIPIVHGMKLIIADERQQKDSRLLKELIVENKVEIVQMTPSSFNMLVYGSETLEFLDGVKEIILGGEVFPKTLFEKLRGQYKGRIINAYGPTETTVYSTFKDLTEVNEINIGKPIANTQIFILDKNEKLLPVGITGEIYISGDGVARGYLNKDDVTKEKFTDNPFVSGKKIYRTGDFGRWLSNGDIESMGRKDTQVKIRGYRIELGEIERRISQVESIKEVVVTILEYADGNGLISKELCCYFVSEKRLSPAYLKKYLSKELPDYMIPSYFTQIDSIPLTPNGKIDRKALPKPVLSRESSTQLCEAMDEIEQKVIEIWKDILNLDTAAWDDNFFDVGGHSLSAAKFVLRLHKELNIELGVTKLFEIPTLKEVSEYIRKEMPGTYTPLMSAERREYYPVSAAQRWMYTLEQLDYNSVAYNNTYVINIEGKLNVVSVKKAIQQMVRRHNSLRTAFEFTDGQVLQKVNQEIELERIFFILPEGGIEETVTGFVRPYDLNTAPLFRVGLMSICREKHILIFDAHHIIVDGTSMELLLKEFIKIYNGELLPEVKIQYQDYAEWENKVSKSEYRQKSENFWTEVYKDGVPALDIPTDYPRPSRKSTDGDALFFEVEEEVVEGLNALARSTGSTIYMILLTVFNIFLLKYTDKEDIVIGSPVSIRNHADLDNVVGMFVNTLPMRNHPVSNKTFTVFLDEVRQFTLRAFEYRDYQFDKLVEKVNVKRDASRNAIYDVMFSYYEHDSINMELPDLKLSQYEFMGNNSNLDLYLTAIKNSDKIRFNFKYCTRLFKRETVTGMSVRFLHILEQIIENPHIKLCHIELATESEKDKVINIFNNTVVDYPTEKILPVLFEEQVRNMPNSVAVVFGDECISYSNLNKKANQIARALIERGADNHSIIGISVQRSIGMIAGLVGILKTGGAFMPIDSRYPEKRIDYMIKDSNIKLLLADDIFIERLKEKDYEIDILGINDPLIYERDDTNPGKAGAPGDLAYVLYTSGSTGTPKGVMIENRGLSNLIKGLSDKIDFSCGRTILALTTISFDIFIVETLLPLSKGMMIILANEEQQKDTRLLSRLIKDIRMDIVQLTPSRLNTLISDKDTSFLDNVGNLLVGGESFPRVLLENLTKIYKSKIFNLYGPTETTVWSTIKHLTDERCISIGKPIANTKIYIVNKDNNIQPVGVPGELCITGDGLARGYLNNEKLTREKFVQLPYLNERLYRTGDYARWKEDGDIEFLGRIDNQVKIRGYRIELGEIETMLLKAGNIKEAVVLVREDVTRNKLLCAYITGEEEINSDRLRQSLSRELPEYMIPSLIIQLEKMPLTQNGKIDRKALPAPERLLNVINEYEAPRNEVEARLSVIWEKVLGCEKVSINSNFFESGGHSLNAIILALEIHKEFNIELKLVDIFNNQTIKELAKYLNSQVSSNFSTIEHLEDKEYYLLSQSQKSIYMICQTENDSISYNVPIAMSVKGTVDIERLKGTWSTLIERHEMLRTSFMEMEGDIFQKINASAESPILFFECEEEQIYEIINDFIKPFDLNSAPLTRLGFIRVSEDNYILVFDAHHIIFDGMSISILVNDFIKIYQGMELPEIKVQYRDYVSWHLDLLKSDRIKKQEEYWLKVLSGQLPILNLPTDYPRQKDQSFEGDRIICEIDEALTNKLKKIALDTETTLFMVLFASYVTLLQRYTGQEDIIVGCPVAGRNHSELFNIIGMFVNVLALRCYPNGYKEFKEFLLEIKEMALKSMENQEYPSELLWDKLDVKQKDPKSNPIYRTVFTMQDTGKKDIDIAGLEFSRFNLDFKISKFDMTLNIEELDSKLYINLEYCTQLFFRETAERIVMHYINILKSITENINEKIEDIEFENLPDISMNTEEIVKFNF